MLLVGFQGTNMLQELTMYVHTVVALLLLMIHECPVLQPFRLQYAALFTPDTDSMRSFFCTTKSHAGFQICLGLS